MKQFSYWDNSKGYHNKLLFEVVAEDILIADKLFTESTGLNPMKGMISVSSIKLPL